jgi:hypothetical protein
MYDTLRRLNMQEGLSTAGFRMDYYSNPVVRRGSLTPVPNQTSDIVGSWIDKQIGTSDAGLGGIHSLTGQFSSALSCLINFLC